MGKDVDELFEAVKRAPIYPLSGFNLMPRNAKPITLSKSLTVELLFMIQTTLYMFTGMNGTFAFPLMCPEDVIMPFVQEPLKNLLGVIKDHFGSPIEFLSIMKRVKDENFLDCTSDREMLTLPEIREVLAGNEDHSLSFLEVFLTLTDDKEHPFKRKFDFLSFAFNLRWI